MVVALKPKDLLDHKGAYKRYAHTYMVQASSVPRMARSKERRVKVWRLLRIQDIDTDHCFIKSTTYGSGVEIYFLLAMLHSWQNISFRLR